MTINVRKMTQDRTMTSTKTHIYVSRLCKCMHRAAHTQLADSGFRHCASQKVCMWPLGTKQPACIYGSGINGAEKPHTVITNTSSKKKKRKTKPGSNIQRHAAAENYEHTAGKETMEKVSEVQLSLLCSILNSVSARAEPCLLCNHNSVQVLVKGL